MPPTKKRKIAQNSEELATEPSVQHPKPTTSPPPSPASASQEAAKRASPEDTTPTGDIAPKEPTDPAPPPNDGTAARLARFKALQARAQKSSQHNLKAAAAESARLATDPNALSALQRKQAFASHKLLKADTEAAGEDFERKRAWDWTVEESEKWDKRMEKKGRHREDVAFQDYTQDARKIYKRQLRDLKPDTEAYERQKAEAVRKMAAAGGLDLVETEEGEIVAVDRGGRFYSTAESTDFVENRPEKGAVDRLVKDMQRAEETRLRKRRERGRRDEDNEGGDVSFINDKNKQFNQKLARFYNKVRSFMRWVV